MALVCCTERSENRREVGILMRRQHLVPCKANNPFPFLLPFQLRRSRQCFSTCDNTDTTLLCTHFTCFKHPYLNHRKYWDFLLPMHNHPKFRLYHPSQTLSPSSTVSIGQNKRWTGQIKAETISFLFLLLSLLFQKNKKGVVSGRQAKIKFILC